METELDLIKFQYYPGDITRPVPIGYITLKQFIDSHRNPTSKILDVFDKIETASMNGNQKLKNELKQNNLYYFTPSAIFKEGYNRRYSNIIRFTGLAQIDIDELESDEALDLKHYIFDNYKEVYCAYVSPSRKGVKALIRIPIVKSVNEFKQYYQAIETEMNWIAGFDSAPKNLALPLFLSYDTDMLFRTNASVWSDKEELQPENLSNLKSAPPPKQIVDGDESVYKSRAYFRKITLDIFKSKLEQINDNGHPQLRSASLVLGSRVGAGYLDQSDAEQFAEWCIRSNNYLQKGIAGYVTTMKWSIRQGINNPKYYK